MEQDRQTVFGQEFVLFLEFNGWSAELNAVADLKFECLARDWHWCLVEFVQYFDDRMRLRGELLCHGYFSRDDARAIVQLCRKVSAVLALTRGRLRTEEVVNEIEVQVEEGIGRDEQVGVRAQRVLILLARESEAREQVRGLLVARRSATSTRILGALRVETATQKGRRLNDVVDHADAVADLPLLGGQGEYERVLLVLDV